MYCEKHKVKVGTHTCPECEKTEDAHKEGTEGTPEEASEEKKE